MFFRPEPPIRLRRRRTEPVRTNRDRDVETVASHGTDVSASESDVSSGSGVSSEPDASLPGTVGGEDGVTNDDSFVGPTHEVLNRPQGDGAAETASRTVDDAEILQLPRGDVYPPSNGGEVRIWNSAKKFAEFGTLWLAHQHGEVDENDHDIRIVDHDNPFLKHKTSCIYAWNALLGLSANNGVERWQARRTVRTFSGSNVDFDLVCCEAPQMLRASVRLAEEYDAKLLLNKHNAIFDLIDQQLRARAVPDFLRRRAVRNLRRFEQAGIDAADAVVFQSENDAAQFAWSDDTVVSVIPNGTDFAAIDDGGDPERVRRRLDVDSSKPLCLFVGAFDYDPNEAAADVIAEELAPALPDVEFLLVGRDPPSVSRPNVTTPGFVDDLPGVLSLADVAICPLTMGSGTKLKMLDYLAAGLPIVTTDVGVQGLPLADGETVLVRNSWDEFASAIDSLVESEALRSSLATNAKEMGERYAWESLMEGYEPVVAQLLS